MPVQDFETVKEYFEDWLDATWYNRDQQRRDRDFYDGRQLTQSEVDELNRRGQPAVVINMIQRKINGLRGMETESRVDPRAHPRTPRHDNDDEVVTDALRFVDDSTSFAVKCSDMAADVFIEGDAGGVFSLMPVMRDGRPEYKITFTRIPHDRLIYDPHSREADFSDAMYTGFGTWMDLDEAEEVWPHAKEVLQDDKSGVTSRHHYDLEDKPEIWQDTNRTRVFVIEMYYQKRVQGELGAKTLWYGCQFTLGGFINEPQPVPFLDEYGDNYNPMLLVSGFVDRDGFRYGAVRQMISPQEEINKRRSKFLHHATMRQIIYEDGAVESVDEALGEFAKPDGAIKVGKNVLKDGRFQVTDSPDLSQAQFQLYQASIQELESIGPNAALFVPGQTQDISGTSFLAQQQAGMREMGPIFDHLRQMKLRGYHIMWWLIRQYWTEERWFRVRDNHDGYKFVSLNRRLTYGQRIQEYMQRGMDMQTATQEVLPPMVLQSLTQRIVGLSQQLALQLPPGTNPQQAQQLIQQKIMELYWQLPELQGEYIATDVTKLDVDIILDVTLESEIVEYEQFKDLVELARHGIQLPPKALIMASRIRDKQAILKMMEPSPEQQQQQMQLSQLQMQELAAKVAEIQAKAQRAGAEAAKATVEAQLASDTTEANISKTLAEAAKADSIASILPAEAEKDLAQAAKFRMEAANPPNLDRKASD